MNTQTQMKPERLVIQGVTAHGQAFHPRDWAERLRDCVSTIDVCRQEHPSPYVYVSFLSGMKSLVVERGLWETNPQCYDFLRSFAHDNNLRTNEEYELKMAVGQ